TAPLSDAATPMRFSADGRHLLTMGDMGEARVWDTSTGQPATPPLHAGGRLAFAAFRASGKEVVTVSKGGTVCVWELPCGPELRRSPAGEAAAGPGSPAESRSIHLPNGVTIRTNEATDGELKPRPLGEQVVENAVLSPDGRRVLICVDATTVHIWDTEGS